MENRRRTLQAEKVIAEGILRTVGAVIDWANSLRLLYIKFYSDGLTGAYTFQAATERVGTAVRQNDMTSESSKIYSFSWDPTKGGIAQLVKQIFFAKKSVQGGNVSMHDRFNGARTEANADSKKLTLISTAESVEFAPTNTNEDFIEFNDWAATSEDRGERRVRVNVNGQQMLITPKARSFAEFEDMHREMYGAAFEEDDAEDDIQGDDWEEGDSSQDDDEEDYEDEEDYDEDGLSEDSEEEDYEYV